MIDIKNKMEIGYIRKSNKIIAEIFEKLKSYIKEGVTTKEIDTIVEDYILTKGANPSTKGYTYSPSIPPFPAASCVSVNQVVIHGIPGSYALKNGDIVKVDISLDYNGYFGDSTYLYYVGDVSDKLKELSDTTKEALYNAIDVAREGNYLNEIGKVVSFTVRKKGYGIVRDFCGHGVGKAIHEAPPVLNYYDPKRKGPKLKAGMVIAIEPMITLGSHEVFIMPDRWTVVTKDGKHAAHWEHSVAITDGEPIILSAL